MCTERQGLSSCSALNTYLTCLYFSGTFGVESVVITDTTGGRVCLECSFSSFSTDTGCTTTHVYRVSGRE